MSDEDIGSDHSDPQQSQLPLIPQTGTSDIAKGKAIQNQLRFWDSLLEVRIRLQKLLVEANKLPQNEKFQQIISNANPNQTELVVPNPQKALSQLLNGLLELDDLLITNTNGENEQITGEDDDQEITSDEDEEIPSDEETINGTKTPDNDDESIGEEEEDEEEPVPTQSTAKLLKKRKLSIDDYEGEIKKRVESYKPIRDTIIQKWNDKTQVSAGKVSSSKQKNYVSFQISTLKQISQILMDKSRLIHRTQVKRSEYEIIGKSKDSMVEDDEEPEKGNVNEISSLNEPEVDPEIFDDDDFYHQLLRELIERKASSLTNPIELSRHWLELQKLRSKTKRKIDTKASKARKIRYEVYSKLVNFMAPLDQNPMTDHGVQELFSSLFGNQKVGNELG